MKLIIGISGNARVGKDTLSKILIHHYFSKLKLTCKQFSFAFCLKKDLEDFLKQKCGVDVWTEDTEIKTKIRDLLVWYGTTWWRTKDPEHWIKMLDKEISNNQNIDIGIISDVRYVNESEWIKSKNGILIHLIAKKNSEIVKPANEHEAKNEPLLLKRADLILEWELLNLSPELSFSNKSLISIVENSMNKFFKLNSHIMDLT